MTDLIDKLIKIEETAESFGFNWENTSQVIDQVLSEVKEVEAEIKSGDITKLKDEMGDLIISTMALSYFLKLDIKECMGIAINKFDVRLSKTIELAQNDGIKNFSGKSITEIMNYWKQAKKLTDISK